MMAISFLCGQIKIILFVENSKEKCSTLPSIPDHNHSSHVELNVHAYWCLILIKLYKTLKVNLYYLIIFDGNLWYVHLTCLASVSIENWEKYTPFCTDLDIPLYRSVKTILCGCGTRIYLCGCHARFLKNRVSHPFLLIFLKGFKTVFNDGIDNGSPLDVAIIPNHDGNDSVVSYIHMRT